MAPKSIEQSHRKPQMHLVQPDDVAVGKSFGKGRRDGIQSIISKRCLFGKDGTWMRPPAVDN